MSLSLYNVLGKNMFMSISNIFIDIYGFIRWQGYRDNFNVVIFKNYKFIGFYNITATSTQTGTIGPNEYTNGDFIDQFAEDTKHTMITDFCRKLYFYNASKSQLFTRYINNLIDDGVESVTKLDVVKFTALNIPRLFTNSKKRDQSKRDLHVDAVLETVNTILRDRKKVESPDLERRIKGSLTEIL